jgi:hypothetical protein
VVQFSLAIGHEFLADSLRKRNIDLLITVNVADFAPADDVLYTPEAVWLDSNALPTRNRSCDLLLCPIDHHVTCLMALALCQSVM